MTRPVFNPQPNYSGVTIQITNPAVNLGPYGVPNEQSGKIISNNPYACTQNCCCTNTIPTESVYQKEAVKESQSNQTSEYLQGYPASYYMNNYAEKERNVNTSPNDKPQGMVVDPEGINYAEEENVNKTHKVDPDAGISPYREYANMPKVKEPEDMTASKNIIENLDERNAEIKEANKNTKEQKIVALTDEYIKSLENYLNSPNDELRLMASKEILTRLDEDKNRYDDAALNALLNKMLQDPSKLIRLAALSAFASQLASGNEYTVQLLQNIQSNPNADKEDALQAADILLKMSAGVEFKNVPVSENNQEQEVTEERKPV